MPSKDKPLAGVRVAAYKNEGSLGAREEERTVVTLEGVSMADLRYIAGMDEERPPESSVKQGVRLMQEAAQAFTPQDKAKVIERLGLGKDFFDTLPEKLASLTTPEPIREGADMNTLNSEILPKLRTALGMMATVERTAAGKRGGIRHYTAGFSVPGKLDPTPVLKKLESLGADTSMARSRLGLPAADVQVSEANGLASSRERE